VLCMCWHAAAMEQQAASQPRQRRRGRSRKPANDVQGSSLGQFGTAESATSGLQGPLPTEFHHLHSKAISGRATPVAQIPASGRTSAQDRRRGENAAPLPNQTPNLLQRPRQLNPSTAHLPQQLVIVPASPTPSKPTAAQELCEKVRMLAGKSAIAKKSKKSTTLGSEPLPAELLQIHLRDASNYHATQVRSSLSVSLFFTELSDFCLVLIFAEAKFRRLTAATTRLGVFLSVGYSDDSESRACRACNMEHEVLS
jgi:hypothetical protein